MSEIKDYVASLGDLIGKKITGAAYSERDGDPVLILNLLHEDDSLTAHYTPLDIKRLYESEKAKEK